MYIPTQQCTLLYRKSSKTVDKWPKCAIARVAPILPDLNIIENVGWLLSRKVYEGGRQFENTATLIEVIKKSWATISISVLENYYNSLKNRIFDVIVNKGGSTKY